MFDVLQGEAAVDGELTVLQDVLVTSHIGGSSEEAILAMGQAAIAGLDHADFPSRIPGLLALAPAPTSASVP